MSEDVLARLEQLLRELRDIPLNLPPTPAPIERPDFLSSIPEEGATTWLRRHLRP